MLGVFLIILNTLIVCELKPSATSSPQNILENLWIVCLIDCTEISAKLGAIQAELIDQPMIISQFCPRLVYFVYPALASGSGCQFMLHSNTKNLPSVWDQMRRAVVARKPMNQRIKMLFFVIFLCSQPKETSPNPRHSHTTLLLITTMPDLVWVHTDCI